MHLRYVLTELAQGLRRNVSMHVAVILTIFVSLTLVGLGLLLNRQADTTADYLGDQLEITVWLCTENDQAAACTGEVTQAQRDAVIEEVESNPEVAGHHTESKQEAFDKIKEVLGEDDPRLAGPNPPVTAESMPESVWIELKDPDEFEGITSAVVGLDGVSSIRDARDILGPILTAVGTLSTVAIGIAVFLVIAALLMVANTIRLAALARRREIGIMRLVGASNLYIALPFLMEAIVTAVLGFALAAGVLAALMALVNRARERFQVTPWVDWADYIGTLGWVALIGLVLTLIPTLVLTRKYLQV